MDLTLESMFTMLKALNNGEHFDILIKLKAFKQCNTIAVTVKDMIKRWKKAEAEAVSLRVYKYCTKCSTR